LLRNLIAKLFELGLRKITCEGGPSLLAQLLKADVVDEYDLTISPITVGGSPQWADALPKTTDWAEVGSAILVTLNSSDCYATNWQDVGLALA
jgi:riboflavin biosynthesis pyrimidine reductase